MLRNVEKTKKNRTRTWIGQLQCQAERHEKSKNMGRLGIAREKENKDYQNIHRLEIGSNKAGRNRQERGKVNFCVRLEEGNIERLNVRCSCQKNKLDYTKTQRSQMLRQMEELQTRIRTWRLINDELDVSTNFEPAG